MKRVAPEGGMLRAVGAEVKTPSGSHSDHLSGAARAMGDNLERFKELITGSNVAQARAAIRKRMGDEVLWFHALGSGRRARPALGRYWNVCSETMVPAEGLEPPTPRLRSGCSTN